MGMIEHLGVEVDVHNKTIQVLEEKVAEIEGHLCHCADQRRGKGKEVVWVEEPLLCFQTPFLSFSQLSPKRLFIC